MKILCKINWATLSKILFVERLNKWVLIGTRCAQTKNKHHKGAIITGSMKSQCRSFLVKYNTAVCAMLRKYSYLNFMDKPKQAWLTAFILLLFIKSMDHRENAENHSSSTYTTNKYGKMVKRDRKKEWRTEPESHSCRSKLTTHPVCESDSVSQQRKNGILNAGPDIFRNEMRNFIR